MTLEEELDNLENYLQIQKARFGDRVRYRVEADPGSLSFEVPNLTLQPFVENAFVHGIEPAEDGGEIRVRVRDEKNRIHIEIADDGPGIPEEKIRSIIRGGLERKSRHSTGIGIINVISRLRLYFDTRDVIEIKSDSQRGTCVHLYLPKSRREQT